MNYKEEINGNFLILIFDSSDFIGCHIERAVSKCIAEVRSRAGRMLILRSANGMPIPDVIGRLKFNTVTLNFHPDSDPEQIAADYAAGCETRSRQWNESDAGQNYREERAAKAKESQATYSAGMQNLHALLANIEIGNRAPGGQPNDRYAPAIFKNLAAVIRSGDDVDVVSNWDELADILRDFGYQAGEHAGPDFHKDWFDTKHKLRAWLAGQVIDLIESKFGQPHPQMAEMIFQQGLWMEVPQ